MKPFLAMLATAFLIASCDDTATKISRQYETKISSLKEQIDSLETVHSLTLDSLENPELVKVYLDGELIDLKLGLNREQSKGKKLSMSIARESWIIKDSSEPIGLNIFITRKKMLLAKWEFTNYQELENTKIEEVVFEDTNYPHRLIFELTNTKLPQSYVINIPLVE